MDVKDSYTVINDSLNRHVKRFRFEHGKRPLVLTDLDTKQPALFLWILVDRAPYDTTEVINFKHLDVSNITMTCKFHQGLTTDFQVNLPRTGLIQFVYLNVSDKPILVDWSKPRTFAKTFNRYKMVNAWHPGSVYGPCFTKFDDDYDRNHFQIKDLKEPWHMEISNLQGSWSFNNYNDIIVTNDLTLETMRGPKGSHQRDFNIYSKIPFYTNEEVVNTRFEDVLEETCTNFSWTY